MWGTYGLPQYPIFVVIGMRGGSWVEILSILFPNGDTTTCTVSYKNRKRKMAGRGLPTNNIPVVIAAATGYIYYVQ